MVSGESGIPHHDTPPIDIHACSHVGCCIAISTHQASNQVQGGATSVAYAARRPARPGIPLDGAVLDRQIAPVVNGATSEIEIADAILKLDMAQRRCHARMDFDDARGPVAIDACATAIATLPQQQHIRFHIQVIIGAIVCAGSARKRIDAAWNAYGIVAAVSPRCRAPPAIGTLPDRIQGFPDGAAATVIPFIGKGVNRDGRRRHHARDKQQAHPQQAPRSAHPGR